LNSEIQVAIDGPSASGKSTVSRRVAATLGFAYVDSGSLYRAVTWLALRDGVATSDPGALAEWLPGIAVALRREGDSVRFTLNGVDPGPALRDQAVVDHVSDVAAVPVVRRFVVDHLRETVRFGSLVMEGRDIGSVVFPGARYKFFLDADPEERARRRHREQGGERDEDGLAHVMASLQRRDRKDTSRRAAPLQVASGARLINSTHMPIDEVVDAIVSTIRASGVEP
jgi:cytidylate kinase